MPLFLPLMKEDMPSIEKLEEVGNKKVIDEQLVEKYYT